MEQKGIEDLLKGSNFGSSSSSTWMLILLFLLLFNNSLFGGWGSTTPSVPTDSPFGPRKGKHYDEEAAKEFVSHLHYVDANGEEHTGEHWALEKVLELTSNYQYTDSTTDWDKYVAYNFMYARFGSSLHYKQLINITHSLFLSIGDCTIRDYLSI